MISGAMGDSTGYKGRLRLGIESMKIYNEVDRLREAR